MKKILTLLTVCLFFVGCQEDNGTFKKNGNKSQKILSGTLSGFTFVCYEDGNVYYIQEIKNRDIYLPYMRNNENGVASIVTCQNFQKELQK